MEQNAKEGKQGRSMPLLALTNLIDLCVNPYLSERNVQMMRRPMHRHGFLGGIAALSALAMVAITGEPSPALTGQSFSCSRPGPGLEVFPGSPNALVATPQGALPGFSSQNTITVFPDVSQANGLLRDGATRCFHAMQRLNALNDPTLAGTMALTFQPTTNSGGTVTGARVCAVPVAMAGTRSCGTPANFDGSGAPPTAAPSIGQSYMLFTIIEGTQSPQIAMEIIRNLGGLTLVR